MGVAKFKFDTFFGLLQAGFGAVFVFVGLLFAIELAMIVYYQVFGPPVIEITIESEVSPEVNTLRLVQSGVLIPWPICLLAGVFSFSSGSLLLSAGRRKLVRELKPKKKAQFAVDADTRLHEMAEQLSVGDGGPEGSPEGGFDRG